MELNYDKFGSRLRQIGRKMMRSRYGLWFATGRSVSRPPVVEQELTSPSMMMRRSRSLPADRAVCAFAFALLAPVVAACSPDGGPDWPVSSGPLAGEGTMWGPPGGEDTCFVSSGEPMFVHFGGHLLENTLREPVTLTGVAVDEHVVGDVSMMDDVYGQHDEIGWEGTVRGYWDEWPPHAESPGSDEVPVRILSLPAAIGPGEVLNPLTGFRVDPSNGRVHIPYVLYTYEAHGKEYRLVDPNGIRVEADQDACDVMPDIFEHEF